MDFESNLSVFLLLYLTLYLLKRSAGGWLVKLGERFRWCLLLSHIQGHVGNFRLKKKTLIEGMQGAFPHTWRNRLALCCSKKDNILKFQKESLKIKHPKHLSHPTLTLAAWGIIELLVLHQVLNVGALQISVWGYHFFYTLFLQYLIQSHCFKYHICVIKNPLFSPGKYL